MFDLDFLEFSVLSTRGMHTSYTESDVVVRTDILTAEWSISGTVSLILFVSLSTCKRSIRMVDFSNFLLCNSD